MKVGIVVAQDFWLHFREILATLQKEHRVSIFRQRKWPFQLMSGRVNRWLLYRDLANFMREQDVSFFEWSEDHFATASHLPKSSSIITRLHLHELWDYAQVVDWSKVDRVIFVSRAMERKFLSRYPEMTGQTRVVHNGVSLSKFALPSSRFRGIIGTLSRLDPHKRIYDLILVLYQLRQDGYDLALHIGGSVTESRYERYGSEVRLLVERLGLGGSVLFQGPIRDTPRWFEEIDIFVSNSCSEGLQVALLEAMASGRHCLSHFWDGVDEVLPSENIYTTEAELIDKVKQYYSASDAERKQAQDRLRAIAVEHFDIDKQKTLIAGIVRDVASAKS